MFKRIAAFFLAMLVLLSLTPAALALTYGNGNATYDFGSINAVLDSAGAGYQKLGDKFKVPNDMYSTLVSAAGGSDKTMIYWRNNGDTSVTAKLYAEGGDTCKSFTFHDLGVSGYGTDPRFESLTLRFFDNNGMPLDTLSLGANDTILPLTSVVNLSTLYGRSEWNIPGVSYMEISYSLKNGMAALNLGLENMKISSVSNKNLNPETPAINIQPTGATVNPESPVTLFVGATVGSGALSYQWYSNTTNSNSGGTLITGATTATYACDTTSIGTAYYYCAVTNTDAAAINTTATVKTNAVAVVINNLTNAEKPTITVQPQNAVVTSGGTASLSLTASVGTGTLSYEWYSNTANSNSGGTPIPGATTMPYTFSPSDTGIRYYYCIVTNTDNTAAGNKTTTAASAPAKITTLHADGTYNFEGCNNAANSAGEGYQKLNALLKATNSMFTSSNTVLAPTGSSYTAIFKRNATGPSASAVLMATGGDVCRTFTFQDIGIAAWPSDTADYNFTALQLILKGYDGQAVGTYDLGASGNLPENAIVPLSTVFGRSEWSVSGVSSIELNFTLNGSAEMLSIENIKLADISIATANAQTPLITTQPVSKNILKGTAADLSIAAAVSTGTLSYQWYSNTAESTIGGTPIPTATFATYSAPTSTASTTYYYCVVTNTDPSATTSTTATATSNIVTVAVSEPVDAKTPVIGTQPADKNVLVNADATLAVSASVTPGTLSYLWYSNTTQSTTGGTPIPTATSASYSPPTSAAGTTYYYCVVTNTDPAATGSTAAAITTDIVAVTVSGPTNAKVPTIHTQPADRDVLVNADATLTVSASVTPGTLSYQWYSNATDSAIGGTPIPTATSASYSAPTSAAGTTYYYCVVTNTDPAATGITTASITTDVAAVTVSDPVDAKTPTIHTQPVGKNVLVSADATLTVSASVTPGTLSYLWYSNTAESTTGGTPIPTATSASYSAPTSAAGTIYYYCVVTNTDPAATGSTTAAITTDIVAVTVSEPVDAKTPVIGTQPADKNVLVNADATLTVSASVTPGTLSYLWYSNATDSAVGGTPIPAATSASYSAPTAATGTTYYYCVVTNTDPAATGNIIATITTDVVRVTVSDPADAQTPNIGTQPADKNVVTGATANLTVSASVTSGTLSYEWYSNTADSTVGGILIPTATSASYAAPTSAIGTIYYYCVVTNTDPAATGSTTAAITTDAAAVTVSAPPPDTDGSSGRTDDIVPSRNIDTDDTSVTVALTQSQTTLSSSQLRMLQQQNETKPVTISGNDYTVTFPAGSIQPGWNGGIDFGLQFNGGENYSDISELAPGSAVLVVSFNHSGPLPAEAIITFFVGSRYAGRIMHYFYFNEATGQLEYRQMCVVDANGYVSVRQSTCSDYVLTDAVTVEDVIEPPKTGSTPLLGYAQLALMATIAALLLLRRTRTRAER